MPDDRAPVILRMQIQINKFTRYTIVIVAVALCVFSSGVGRTEESGKIVDVRFDGPYRQVDPSNGDEWAPTWGRGDVLYTGNDDGYSFGGVPDNAVAFGKLTGDDPYRLTGSTVNGMDTYKEIYLGPELSRWKILGSYKINGFYYRFALCALSERSHCLEWSSDGNEWIAGDPVLEGSKFQDVRFITWSKRSEENLGANAGDYVYAASYVGVINGEDQYLLARAPRVKWPKVSPGDWSFRQGDSSWGLLEGAQPGSSNRMLGADGANWKATNAYSVDGILYMFVTRCTYPSQSSDAQRRHIWQNSSVIKSTDEGLTWTRSPDENYAKPMFSGQRFGTPYFVWYGKDGAGNLDNAGNYVYAVSNNGFFENGDNYVLGRVPRAKLANLSAADWSFYVEGDGMDDRSWNSRFDNAKSILGNPGRSSMAGMTYIPHLRRYMMVTWHYNRANFEEAIRSKDLSTVLEFFEAPKPWGPWFKVKSYETGKLGWYAPIIGQRFQTSAGTHAVSAFLYLTGLSAKPEGGLDYGLYKFTYIPITLSTTPLKHQDPAYVGSR